VKEVIIVSADEIEGKHSQQEEYYGFIWRQNTVSVYHLLLLSNQNINKIAAAATQLQV
jgi:hypothetical protein